MSKEPNGQQMIERVVRFTVNGEAMPSFICTPDCLDELAVGFLLTQGQLKSADEVLSVIVDGLTVAVTTRAPVPPAVPIETRAEALMPVAQAGLPAREEISSLMRALLAQDAYYGTHTLGLQTPDGVIFRQDIGRHNAMDKIIGRAAMDGVDFARCRVAATGRISLEMLLKAAGVGVPVIFSKKYPSDFAITIAERIGVILVAHALSDAPVVYNA